MRVTSQWKPTETSLGLTPVPTALHYGNRLFCRVPRHTAKAKIPTTNSLSCVAHGKKHTANRRRQRGLLPCAIYRAHGKEFAECQKTDNKEFFRKLILKIRNKKNNSWRTPPVSHVSIPTKSQITTVFVHIAFGRFRTRDLSLTSNLLYHYTTHSVLSILHFLSPYTILNRV